MKHLFPLLVAVVTTTPVTLADEQNEVEPWDRIVCIQSRVESKPDTGKLCSAFIVEADGSLFLVTAGHASAETNLDSRLRYRDPTGKTQWVTLKAFVQGAGNPWHRDAVSDVAIAKIPEVSGTETYFGHFKELAISIDVLQKESPRRTAAIVAVGFPLAIGATGEISPVAVVGNIASRETSVSNTWGKEPIIFCSPALAQGTSGGPAFLQSVDGDRMAVVGMYIGVVSDASGAKLSKLVPARIIHEAITRYRNEE
jgi:energy-converting hydrogenase Eha subunit A